MPLTKPCFRVPLTDNLKDNLGMDGMRGLVSRMAGDPQIRLTVHTIDIDYTYEDIVQFYRDLRAAIGANTMTEWVEKFATAEYKEEMAKQLEESRDHFDGFAFGPPANAGIVNATPAQAGAQQALGTNPGLVLGNEHTDLHTKDLAIKLMESGQVGLVFVEEFPVSLQTAINTYLDPAVEEMPAELAEYVARFKVGKGVDLAPMLEKAKATNSKLYGIDGGDAHLLDTVDPRHHENRCAVMNKIAEKVMTDAIGANPNVKFLALCGEAHSNTFSGGIPGLAQIMNVPAVKMSKTGKLSVHAEDPTQRRQPSKAEQAFVDQYMKQVTDAYAEAVKDLTGENKAESIDFIELRNEALGLADQFQQGGLLNAPGDVANLLTVKATTDKQTSMILRTSQRHLQKKDLKKMIEQGLDVEMDNQLRKIQANDPHGYHRLVTGEEEKETLLHIAAKAGQAGCLDRLAGHGFDLEATTDTGRTALQLAAAEGKGPAVKKLVERGADVNAATYMDGKTALHLAAEAGADASLDELLKAPGIDVNRADAKGATPMHVAAAAGKTSGVGKLQAKGAPLNGADPQGKTALHHAIAAGQIATALEMIKNGADVKALAGGKSPLHLAAEKGDLALLNALMQKGADMNQADADGRTPLHHAILAGKADLAGRLILRGARADAPDPDGNTPLHLALEKKMDSTVQGLLVRGVDPKVRNKQGLSAVDVAAQAGGKNAVVVKHVADKGYSAQISTDLEYLNEFLGAARDEYNQKQPRLPGAADTLDEREAAQLAIERVGRLRQRGDLTNDKTTEEIAKLAKTGAKRTDANKMYARAEGRKPRISALTDLAGRETPATFDANLIEITRILDEDPALIHAVPTLLHDACKQGNERLVALLLQRGANVLHRNPGAETPLHKSCEERADLLEVSPAAARTMAAMDKTIPKKTEQDFIDEGTAKARDRATRSANIAKALLNAVPDPKAKGGLLNAQTKRGMTALHLAAYSDHPTVIKDLCAAGARDDITDQRGWRPIEVAMASTKAKSEKALLTHGTQSAAPLVDPNTTDSLSTIDILCKATLCENPAHKAQVRKAFTQLYANEALRPIMDLAALDALRPRVSPSDDPNNANVGGVRFIVSEQQQVGNLYNAKNLVGSPQGAYDEKVNIMLVAGSPKADGNDFTGNVIHEMTHLATRIVYGKDTKPCDNANQQEYIDAVEKDVANATLIEGKSVFEKTAKKILCGRMTGSSYAPRGDGTILTEFIVGVPQIMAQFGEKGARQIAPELSSFFDDFKDECERQKADTRFDGVRDRMDNTRVKEALKKSPKRDERPVSTWTESDALPDLDKMMERIEAYYKAQKGVKLLGKDELGRDQTICFDTSLYRLDPARPPDPLKPNDQGSPPDPGYAEFRKKMKTVRATLKKSFDATKLGDAVSQEDLTRLLKETTDLAMTKTSKELESAIPSLTASWTLRAKKNYLETKVEQKLPVTTREVAELVVLKAEEATWDQKWDAGDLAVDEDKHKSVIKALTEKLDTLTETQRETLLKSPKAYINHTTNQILTGTEKPFYAKVASDPGHISINKKEWIRKLATF